MSLRLAPFVSGGGTTMDSAIQAIQSGKVPGIEPALVVASKPGIEAIGKAVKRKVPVEVIENTLDPVEILLYLYRYNIDLIFQNGYLPKVPKEIVQIYSREFLDPRFMETEEWKELWAFIWAFDGNVREWLLAHAFRRYIFNQHPGSVRADHLDFGGDGMFMARVTAARVLYLLATKAEWDDVFTESTVQYTHPEFDKWIPLWVKRLDFAGELDEFRRSCDTEPIWQRIILPDVQEKLKEFTGRVQALLLPLEHQNVIELLQKVGRWEELIEAPEYRQILVPERWIGILKWARDQMDILYPRKKK